MPGGERIIDVSMRPAYLSLDTERLRIRIEDEPDSFVPLAETAVVVLGHARVTCSGAALAGVMRHGGSVVVCDDGHSPVGMMLPLGANALQTQRIRFQLDAGLPLRKRLWKGIVQDKIRAQAHTLELHIGEDAGLRAIAARVQSGDRQNAESTAAQRYWPRLFGDPMFRRRREASDQNRLLNYGYAVVRAAVGRAICAAGLHASVALHHRHRENAWALADDLIEPYRTLVDDEVAEIVGSFGGDVALDSRIKRRLIGVLHERIWGGSSENRTALDWIGRTATSLVAAFAGEADRVFYPEGLHRAPPRH
ncbi:MAG: type II CRISPR-associated endonuclease Cas1 [Phycisphaerae bacterium]|nr:type II CRISPR-associated endonuclease Cas1 [Phycisphaerae bacterium]|tara:strand:+ start:41 stop:964 length:924 start_codon:yes stop_codon:yes gene_type:complete